MDIKNNIKGLIFDLDGTLADTMGIHFFAWQEVAAKLNFSFPEKLFYELAGMPTTKIVEILNKKNNSNFIAEEILPLKEKAFLKNIDKVEPIDKICNLAKKYFNQKPISIGTGGKKSVVLQTLDKIGMKKYFEIIVTAEDVEKHKPDPETFLLCAKLMKIAPKDCIVFEDGDQGLLAAQNAGMQATDIRPII